MLTLSSISNTNPWLSVFNAVNSIIGYFGSDVVTANGSADGAVNSGNGFVTGIFGATILAANNIRGGTVNTAAPVTITSNIAVNSSYSIINGNNVVNSTAISVGANVGINTSTITLGSIHQKYVNAVTSGTSEQLVDYIDFTVNRSAEYCLTITDQGSSSYQISKILLIHDGSTAKVTEYGVISSNASLGYFSATANSSHALLKITPVPSATSIKGHKFLTTV